MRYRNQKYLDEINDVNTDDEHVIGEQPDLPVKDPEEESWKKRYGDLRRKAQADATTLEGRLKALENQLSEAKQGTVKLPKTEEEVSRWMAQYPDVAGIIETMIIQKTGGNLEKIRETQEKLDAMEHDRKLQEALNELLASHPDFLEIRSTVEFNDWTKEQPHWVNVALYDENTIDVRGAIRAVDLYKSDLAKLNKANKPAAPAPSRDTSAATAVRTPRTESPSGPRTEWLESEVEAMDRRTYQRYEDEIDKAIRTGKFIYDLSAGAR